MQLKPSVLTLLVIVASEKDKDKEHTMFKVFSGPDLTKGQIFCLTSFLNLSLYEYILENLQAQLISLVILMYS